jgi:hypothetical protein
MGTTCTKPSRRRRPAQKNVSGTPPKTSPILASYPRRRICLHGRVLATTCSQRIMDLLLPRFRGREASQGRCVVRTVLCCSALCSVFIVCSPVDFALAESSLAVGAPTFLSATNSWNTSVDQVTMNPSASPYASAVKASTEVCQDSGPVKPAVPPQSFPPSSGGPKPSFWQWLSGQKVDCSSGVCVFR